jgi:hypothetical protein
MRRHHGRGEAVRGWSTVMHPQGIPARVALAFP